MCNLQGLFTPINISVKDVFIIYGSRKFSSRPIELKILFYIVLKYIKTKTLRIMQNDHKYGTRVYLPIC